MKVVVTGATGNVGTSVLSALIGEPAVDEIVGLARRVPDLRLEKVRWIPADVASSDLTRAFAGAAVVIHLAWLLQPARRERQVGALNVEGTRRVLEAMVECKVPALVYASSVGAYAPGPKRPTKEQWPATGVSSSYYSRQKAEVERMLDDFEAERPAVRVVRMRKALVFKREAGAEITRLFIGSVLPASAILPRLLPILPLPRRFAFQAVHSLDAADAYRRAALSDARGAFNIAADPVLDREELGRLFEARPVPAPEWAVRAACAAAFRARLIPTDPGWIDLLHEVPIMDTQRARTELGWRPRHDATAAVLDILEGIRAGSGLATVPLQPSGGGELLDLAPMKA